MNVLVDWLYSPFLHRKKGGLPSFLCFFVSLFLPFSFVSLFLSSFVLFLSFFLSFFVPLFLLCLSLFMPVFVLVSSTPSFVFACFLYVSNSS